MLNKRITLIFLFLLVAHTFYGIDLKYATYDWEKSPKLHALTETEKPLEELILKEKQAIEYLYDAQGNLNQYKLYHKIIRVNSNEAIEKNNKIYIPLVAKTDFLLQKARVITSSGRVIEMQEKDIKEAVEEESKVTFKFFALEGLDLGSEIEYFYLLKTNLRYTGSREVLQSKIPKKNVELEVISPSNLIFKFKSYNGLPDLQLDSAETTKRVMFIKLDNLEGLRDEDYSAHQANLKQFVYKLNSNTQNNSKDIISYGFISERIYKTMMAPAEKGELKSIKKLLQQINVKFAKNDEDKIRTIENYLKVNFVLIDNGNPAFGELKVVLEKKVANEEGMTKLFAAIFNELGFDYQIVITSDRSNMKFDKDFEAYNFLVSYLIYLPTLKMYLSPFERFNYLGFVPYNLTHNYGLFIKKVSLENYSTGIGKINFIPAVPYDKTNDNLDIKVTFTDEMLRPTVTLDRQMTGYYALYYQPFYSYYSEDDKKKSTDGILKDFIPGIEVKQVRVENEGKDYFGVLPFIVKATFTSDNIVEKAGAKYLFKVGDLIGRQMEMYQKEERKLDIENDFNRNYHREISFEIPAGYKITNLDALNMDIYSEENGERVIAFTSKYEIVGNKVKVIIDEYYKKLLYPASEYENYRKVINAAADFNKVTLFIEKL